MDRLINYPGAIPLETDLLNTNKNTMIALAKLVAATMGTTTQVNGLSVVQTTVASLQVNVNPGEIYSLQNVDNTAFSSLAADTAHQIMKQGILLNQVLLNCPAPGTVGQSINYLIEASYQDTDALPVVLPYYNASNPSTAYSGPANAGTTNNTVRQGTISLVAKAGVSAATGSQTTPAVDSGYTALYVVTVAYSQTQIVAGNITAVVGAPFLNTGMLGQIATLLNTPVQFDNSTKVANTAFVQRALGNFAVATQLGVGATTNLTAAQAGQYFQCQGGTVNLPASAGMTPGATYSFSSSSSTAVVTSGTDKIYITSGALSSVTLNGENMVLVLLSVGVWEVISGTITLPYSSYFASSQAPNGYQKLPSGNIRQWGSLIANATPFTGTAASFATNFPNNCLSLVLTPFTSSFSTVEAHYSTKSNSGFTLLCNQASITVSYIAEGN